MATAISEIIAEYIDELVIVQGLSAQTVDNYSRDLYRFLHFAQSRDIHNTQELSEALLLDFLAAEKAAGHSAATRARRLSCLRGFCRYMAREGVAPRDISQNIRSPKQQRPFPYALSQAEMSRLLAAPDTSTLLGMRDQAMLELGYGCGLRVSELIGLSVYDIDYEAAFARIFGKGAKERMVPIGEFANRAVQKYLRDSRPQLLKQKTTQELFVNARGDKLSRSGFWRILNQYGRTLKLEVHPHTLRHSAATHMLENGADLRILQEFLGHSDISTTQIYVKMDKSELKSIYRHYHPRARVGEE